MSERYVIAEANSAKDLQVIINDLYFRLGYKIVGPLNVTMYCDNLFHYTQMMEKTLC